MTIAMKTDGYSLALARLYDVAAPRYTSYPTVPCWDTQTWDADQWTAHVRERYFASSGEGISLYIHLPFCESLCTYCGCNTRITRNHAVEAPYVDAILAEWTLYRRALEADHVAISEIHLGGGTPTFFHPTQLARLVDGLTADGYLTADASLSFEAHPANTNVEHLETLYAAGFRRLSLGIQDFDPVVQSLINRRQTEADVHRVMDEARRIGYTSINFDLIYGLPRQTLESITDTMARSMSLQPDRISFYSYAHVPWLKPGQRHYSEEDLPSGPDKLALYVIGRQVITDAGYRDVGMDHFALPSDSLWQAASQGRLHRNFMGYTDRYTPLLIGLGVSSIGDAWTAFAQNVKTVEAYHEAVNQGKLPVFRGHVLDHIDLKLRRHILDLMCFGETSLQLPAALTARIHRRLVPLETDGLVESTSDRVWVTPLGRSFLRNICMAFDERLHTRQIDGPLFSRAV